MLDIILFTLNTSFLHDPAPLFIACNTVFQDIFHTVVFQIILISGIPDLF